MYIDCVSMFRSNLIGIIEINIRKKPLPRRVTTTWSTNKTLQLSLVLGKAVESYYNLLLASSDYESYLT